MADDSIISFKADGKVRLLLDGKQVSLRRPKMGEVHRFQDALDDALDEWVRLTEQHQENLAEKADELGVDLDANPIAEAAARLLGNWATLSTEMPDSEKRTETLTGWVQEVVEGASAKDDEPESHEWRSARRKLNRDLNRKVAGLWIALGRDIVATLAPPNQQPPDDDDELDPALGSQSLYVALLRHWTHVPLPSGA